jgi:two-component system, OmpR family, catabolic regulation response regulator CreB
MQHCWPDPGTSIERTVDARMAVLRKKLKAIEPTEEILITHVSVGYSLKG